MSIQSILARGPVGVPDLAASQSAQSPAGVKDQAPARELPEDHVVVSEQARSLANAADGGTGGRAKPELQLSPQRLRELVTGEKT